MRLVGLPLGVAALLAIGGAPSVAAAPGAALPVIDVHRHASRIGADDDAARQRALESMAKNNIGTSLIYVNESSDLGKWSAPAPHRFIASVPVPCWRNADQSFYCFAEGSGWPDLAWLEKELASGRVAALGEMLFNYAGVSPTDERMWPYWALAAKYDVPVLVHTGRGPGPGEGPRKDANCCPDYDASYGNPALLRPVLERYPTLRVALLHFGAGMPPEHAYFHDEALALMRDYPSVYADMTIVSSLAPPPVYASELRRLIDAGFGDRIMFGTDNLPPEPILERLTEMEWLGEKQRRAILHDNAARFLRLHSASASTRPGRQ